MAIECRDDINVARRHFSRLILVRFLLMTESNDTTLKELNAFCDDLRNETDRAVVIIGGAKLDQQLHELLERFLIPSSTGEDVLLDSDRAVGTFSSRIHLAHRLGLIDAEFAWALHLIRKIRNSFAHQLASASFNAGRERDRVRELSNVMNQSRSFREIVLPKFTDEDSSPSGEFRAIISCLSILLERAAVKCTRLDASQAMPLLE